MEQGGEGVGREGGRVRHDLRYAVLLCVGAMLLPLQYAGAANYPARPVRLIVGFPPGGAADILGRIAAQQLTERLHQQVVVDNRGGAGGLVATEIAARARSEERRVGKECCR